MAKISEVIERLENGMDVSTEDLASSVLFLHEALSLNCTLLKKAFRENKTKCSGEYIEEVLREYKKVLNREAGEKGRQGDDKP